MIFQVGHFRIIRGLMTLILTSDVHENHIVENGKPTCTNHADDVLRRHFANVTKDTLRSRSVRIQLCSIIIAILFLSLSLSPPFLLSLTVHHEIPLFISSSSDEKELDEDDGDSNVSHSSIIPKTTTVCSSITDSH